MPEFRALHLPATLFPIHPLPSSNLSTILPLPSLLSKIRRSTGYALLPYRLLTCPRQGSRQLLFGDLQVHHSRALQGDLKHETYPIPLFLERSINPGLAKIGVYWLPTTITSNKLLPDWHHS